MNDSPALSATKFVTDLDNASDFELKHTPTVVARPENGGYELEIHTGVKVAHPMLPEHWINWLDVRVGDASIARFDMSDVTAPHITCHAALGAGTTIRVISSCNIHGLWGTEVTL